MRTDAESLLRDLAEAGQLVHLEHLPARPGARPAAVAAAARRSRTALAARRAVDPPGGRHRPGPGRPLRRRRHRHRVGQVALLPGAVAEAALDAAAGRPCCSSPPRPWPRTSCGRWPRSRCRASWPRPTTATRRPRTGPWARRHANVVLTNPDMLHVGILPNHAPLGHVPHAAALRRARRAAHAAGHLRHPRRPRPAPAAAAVRPLRLDADVRVRSATIGEPGRLASALCGLPVDEVTDDGSPRGERLFALWNPPLLDEAAGRAGVGQRRDGPPAGRRWSRAGHRGIAFSRSRKGAELVAAEARRRLPEELAATRAALPGRLPRRGAARDRGRAVRRAAAGRRRHHRPRAGHRRRRARRLRAQRLPRHHRLDVAAGGPGRARRQQRSLAVLVAGDDALDQWFMAHPTEVFTRSPEPAVVNPANPFVLDPHLACAAYELPLTAADDAWWGDDLDDGVRRLVLDDRLELRGRPGRATPAGRRRRRGSGCAPGRRREYRIVDADGRLIGTVDESRAFERRAPGRRLPAPGPALPGRPARPRRPGGVGRAGRRRRDHPGPHRTPTSRILGERRSRSTSAGPTLHLGPVEVTEQVDGLPARKRLVHRRGARRR